MNKFQKYLILTLVTAMIGLACGKNQNNVKELSFAFTPISLPDSVWSIGSLVEHQNRLYFFDRDQGMLWKCALNGEFIGNLELKKGQGPGEIMEPAGLAASGDKLFLLDWQLRRITCFDTAFTYLYDFTIPFQRLTRMHIHRDTLYLLAGENETQRLVHRYDLKGNKIDEFVPYFDIPELEHLRENEMKDIGAFFTPTAWTFQCDTIWIKDGFRYRIAGYKGDKKIAEIRGDDNLVRPPTIQHIGNSIATQGYGMSTIYVYQNKMMVYLQYLEDDNKRIYKNTIHLYNLTEGSLIAEKTWLAGPDDVRPPSPRLVKNDRFYFTTSDSLFLAEIIIK